MTLPFWSPPGETSEHGQWVWFLGAMWMYNADTIPQLVWQVVFEFRNDRHLVG